MENILMSGGAISATILAIIGLFKIPIAKILKEKHPKTFRALMTILTLALVVVGVAVNQAYISEVKLFTSETLILLLTVVTGVFVTYNGIYEGLSVKKLVAVIVDKLKQASEKKAESKFAKFVNKIGNDKVAEIINSLQEKEKQATEQPAIEEKQV